MSAPRRRVRTLLALAAGLLVCAGCDYAYDALVSFDRGTKFWLGIVVSCAINVLSATSLNVVNGMAGQFSIGHAGFVGVGAYVGGMVAAHAGLWLGLTSERLHDNLSLAQSMVVMPVVLTTVVVSCAGLGFLVGLPSLRLRGDYLAILTLGFSEILRLTILGTSQDEARNNTISRWLAGLGGALGYRGPKVDGDYTGVPSVAGPFWVFGCAALAVFLALRLKRSGFGRALRAVREDEIAASAVGVSPALYKVTAFVLAAAGAGVAGALLALKRDGPGIVSPSFMRFERSFEVIAMVILGGSGSVGGAAIGAVLYTAVFYLTEECLSQLARSGLPFVGSIDAAALRMALFAAALVAVMLWRPEGLYGEREPFEPRRPPRRRGPSAKAGTEAPVDVVARVGTAEEST